MALPEPVRPTCEPEDVPLFPVPGTYFHFCFLVLKVLNSDFWVCTHFPILVLGIESIKFGFQNNWCVLVFMVFTCFHYCLPIVKLLYSEFRVLLIFHYWILDMKVLNPDFRLSVDFFSLLLFGYEYSYTVDTSNQIVNFDFNGML